ncbi:MAG TPA: c-type cytochrome [Gemmatimonadales bacterium]|nr:c-type cytochrome [Gemmatimonadales bacterium]
MRLLAALGLSVLLVGFALSAPPVAGTNDVRPDSLPEPKGYSIPADSEIPGGPLGVSIRRGRAIVLATRDSLPRHVGNRLACTNCHLDAGTRASSGPWVGVFATFPQYNARAGRVFRIENRVNECLRRSLNGTPLPLDGRDMTDIVAYLAFLSRHVPTGSHPDWLGYPRLPARTADARAGATIFASSCARCHGPNGAGTSKAPPLWGAQSFAIGAGMARLQTAAAFARWNMPFDRPGTLSDQQAYDVAAFILSHPRPDTPGKERDWPNGDPPVDVAYSTLAGRRQSAPTHP